jgi:hypothetical protein
MSSVSRTVFVLGAGFTKAFLSDAPLLEDDYDINSLVSKYKNFDLAHRILELEKERGENGRVNVERLMTRLDDVMPYDRDDAPTQFGLLRSEIHSLFMDRMVRAKAKGVTHPDDLTKFASYCVANNITCITFNYDDILDEALWKVRSLHDVPAYLKKGETYWHPDGGYGFFCKPSITCVKHFDVFMDKTAMLLLKLHGSVNWRIKLGYAKPYSMDAIVHHEPWLPKPFGDVPQAGEIESHLKNDCFIVPPVLSKSSFVEEPILRLVWGKAFLALYEAGEVVFVGYSFPVTDLAATFLFSETIPRQGPRVKVVVLPRDTKEKVEIEGRYRRVFPNLHPTQFQFRDALDWARELAA